MKNIILPISLLLLSLTSCQREEEVNMNLPQKSKLISITFIGTGNQSIMSSLTRSTPVIGTVKPDEPTYVTNGNGTISHRGETYSFVYDDASTAYYADMGMTEILSGETYTIEFSDGKETVKGTAVVPYPTDVNLTMKLDTSYELGGPALRANFTCTSESGGLNYIQLVPVMILSDSSRYGMTDFFSNHKIPGLVKGQSFSQSFLSTFSSDLIYPVRIEVMVFNCDEAYAKYYNSTNGFDYSMLIGSFGEPRFAYSNMSNGIGVIASYAVSETISFDVE